MNDGGVFATAKQVDDILMATAEDQESVEPQPKRAKRGRYVSRACGPCQKRKIKCDGANPCSQCVHRNRPCRASSQALKSTDGNSRGSQIDEPNNGTSNETALTDVLVNRLALVERQLTTLLARDDRIRRRRSERRDSLSSSVADDPYSPMSTVGANNVIPEADGQIFAGEISISHALRQLDDDGQRMPAALTPESSKASLNLKTNEKSVGEAGDSFKDSVKDILTSHGVVPEQNQWEGWFRIYTEQVHVLYPFLHLPGLRNTFSQLWTQPQIWTTSDSPMPQQTRIRLAMIVLCVAIGRCTGSSRVEDTNATEKAGWDLYCVARDLLKDHLDISKAGSKSLMGLEVLVLMVVYLFRLDVNLQAARILAMAVSEAQSIGLHRRKTLRKLPFFQAELSRRLWWCLYVLDRRIALETAQPFLIQDFNLDVDLPTNLSDEWLTEVDGRMENGDDLAEEISMEVQKNPVTSIPYIAAMIQYSGIVGKAWELLYGVKGGGSMRSYGSDGYIETLLNRLQNELPASLRFDPLLSFESQFADRTRWQSQQALLLYMRCALLRILIHKPVAPDTSTTAVTNDTDLEIIIASSSLAASIIKVYQRIPEGSVRYSFPFGHYLTNATMLLSGMILKEPDLKRRYGQLVRSAIRDLKIYCHKTWVSGKMFRSISKLDLMTKDMREIRPTSGRASSFHQGMTRSTPDQIRSWDPNQPASEPINLPRGPQSSSPAGDMDQFGAISSVDRNIRSNLIPDSNSDHSQPKVQRRESSARQDNLNYLRQPSTGLPQSHLKRTTTGVAASGREDLPTTSSQVHATSMSSDIIVPPTATQGWNASGSTHDMDPSNDWLGNGSTSSSLGTTGGGGFDFPSWAMTDFEFEQNRNGREAGWQINRQQQLHPRHQHHRYQPGGGESDLSPSFAPRNNECSHNSSSARRFTTTSTSINTDAGVGKPTTATTRPGPATVENHHPFYDRPSDQQQQQPPPQQQQTTGSIGSAANVPPVGNSSNFVDMYTTENLYMFDVANASPQELYPYLQLGGSSNSLYELDESCT